MSAELEARRTAAAAVDADFRREADAFIHDDTLTLPAPDYCGWAFRLSSELRSLLQQLDSETARTAHPAVERLAAIRDVLAGFDWEYHDRQLALEAIDRIASGGQR